MWLGAGRWYWEVLVDTSSGNGPDVGYIDKVTSGTSNYLGQASGAAWRWDGNFRVNNSYASGTFASYTSGDYLGFYLDLEDNKIYIAKNGTIQNSGTAARTDLLTTMSEGYTPIGFTNKGVMEFNFGNPSFSISSGNSDGRGYGNFEYAVPSGYYSVCTKNLAEFGENGLYNDRRSISISSN